MKKILRNLLDWSLWLVGFGLMLASSGLDGAFLVKLMPDGWSWLGLVLNTTTDVASEVISYWFGRLAQDSSKRKRTLAIFLWIPQCALVFYAWLFGWRQIIPVLKQIEPDDWHWLAPTMAAFVPVALVAVGYTQALLAGRVESDKKTQKLTEIADSCVQDATFVAQNSANKTATISDWREICADLNGQRKNLTPDRVNQILISRGFAPKPESTARYWCRVARGERK